MNVKATATIMDQLSMGTTRAELCWRDVFFVVGASLLLGLSAHVQIPGPLPLTMQTFVVVLVAAALGSKRGTAAVLAYLVEGAAGLPVFAHGTAGVAYFAGPTAGYLAGFVVAAWVVGRLAERGWDRRFATAVVAFLAGHLVILTVGFAWRSAFVGPVIAAADGFVKTLPGMLIKTLLAAMVLPMAWRLVGRSDESAESDTAA